MADKKPRGIGRRFVKGDPRIGRHALPKEILQSRKIAFREYNVIALELLNSPYEAILAVTKDNTERTDKRMIAAAIRFGVEGNQPSLNAIWDRVYGKVPEKIDHSGLNMPSNDVSHLSTDDLKAIRDIYIAAQVKTIKENGK